MKEERIKQIHYRENYLSLVCYRIALAFYASNFLFYFLKKTLLLLLFLSLSSLSLKSNEPYLNTIHPISLLEEIKSIKNPEEQALEWLFYFDKNLRFSPQFGSKYLQEGELFLHKNYSYKEAVLLLALGKYNQIKGNYLEANNKFLDAKNLLNAQNTNTLHHKKLLSICFNNLASISKYTKEESEGLNYAFKALELARQSDFIEGQILAYVQKGEILIYMLGENKLALNNFLNAKSLLTSIELSTASHLELYVLPNIAYIYSLDEKFEKSTMYFHQLLEHPEMKNNLKGIAAANNCLGKNYFLTKQYNLAIKHLELSLKDMDIADVNSNQGYPLLWLSYTYLRKGNLDKAYEHIVKIEEWLKKNYFNFNAQPYYFRLRSDFAKNKNDLETAISWLELATDQQDSISRNINLSHLVQMQNRDRFKEFELEKSFLEKNLKIDKERIRAQNILLIVSLILGILMSVFSYIFYQQKRTIKEAYNFIIEKDKVLTTPNKKKNIPNVEESITTVPVPTDELLKTKIIKALEEDKLFLSKELNLKMFADHLNSNTSYISKTINEGCGKNFNSLINEYRVKEIIQLFQEGQHHTFTIETLSQKAGFKSKSSFQKAFKKYTGVTASYYLEQIS